MGRTFNRVSAFVMIAMSIIMVFFGPLYGVDSFITDHIYTRLTGTDSRIVIIGIDEETLSEYGNFNLWSREKMAELIDMLYEDEENAPAVVGLDFIFSDDYDGESDKRLSEAAGKEGRDVVAGTNIVYRGRVERDASGEVYYNTEHISNIELPYEELGSSVNVGFTNECIAKDGYVRYAMNSVDVPEELSYKDENQDSFAYAIYKQYCSKVGEDAVTPRTNSGGQFQFRYSGESGEFSKLSLGAVLSGKIPATTFKDAIVLVGAYAPGFQDSYQPASDRGSTMYGVEIHANIIQAYMQGKTMVTVQKILMALLTAFIMLIFLMVVRRQGIGFRVGASVAAAIIYTAAGMILAAKGIYIPCVYIYILLFITDIYFIVDNYQKELKAQMWSFTEAMAAAVDERTPYNATHTRNVAKYCGMLADYINKLHYRGKEKEHFSEHRKEQLVMGALLHDIGKMAVPLSVMNKATRLGGRENDIEKRLELIRLKAQVEMLLGNKDEAWYEDIKGKTEEAWKMVLKVNAAGFVDDETRNELERILDYSYGDTSFFTDEEKMCLRIVKGTLTEGERKVMESHVTITTKILSKVHFNRYFKNSPVYAGQHHECLNGKGYPNGLTAEELSVDARIMAVADICDALLATDRPYKKPIPMEKAFDSMRDMAQKGNIDGKYVEYLYQCLSADKAEG